MYMFTSRDEIIHGHRDIFHAKRTHTWHFVRCIKVAEHQIRILEVVSSIHSLFMFKTSIVMSVA